MDVALVIAGNSFVGRHLCRRLEQAGIPFRATSRTPLPDCLACDLTRPHEVDAVLAQVRPKWIFACAGGTPQTSLWELYRLHVTGSQTLLWAVARNASDAVTV